MSATSLPLVPALRPTWTESLPRRAAIVLAGSLALAVSAQVQVPMWPVPITGQTLVVLLLGFTLGPRLAGATTLAYLAEGAMGLPVFAGFAGGPAVLVGPTAGYLWGFVAAAVLTGVLAERGWHRSAATVMTGMVLGNLVIYALGAGWLAVAIGADAAISNGVLPFLVGDAAKIVLATLFLPSVAARVDDRTAS